MATKESKLPVAPGVPSQDHELAAYKVCIYEVAGRRRRRYSADRQCSAKSSMTTTTTTISEQ